MNVLYFAWVRERIGVPREEVSTQATTVAELVTELRAREDRYDLAFSDLSALRVATQQAQAVAETVGDDESALGDSLVRLCQEKVFSLLLKVDEIDVKDLDLPKMARAIADLNRSAVQQKKWQIDLRRQVADVASAVTDEVKERGLVDQFAEQIRAKILGIGAGESCCLVSTPTTCPTSGCPISSAGAIPMRV